MKIKKILMFLFVFLLNSFVVFAQGPPPPPPPLIYSAPNTSEFVNFNSKENKFKVSFPGTPKVETVKSEENTVTVFRVYRSGSNSIVAITEFKKKVENLKDEFLMQYKEKILKTPARFKGNNMPTPKIVEENKISYGKIEGFEIKYEFDLGFHISRVFIVGKRVYELKTDVTNWHILSDNFPNKVKDFHNESDRFFKSFELIK